MNLTTILYLLFYLVTPALAIWLCRKVEFIGKIGSILVVYFIGLLFGNSLIFPFEGMSETLYPFQDALTSITIPLAIPLILFSCNFRRLPLRAASLSLIFGVIAMITAVITGYFLFRGLYDGENFNKIAGMIVGVYTGGTPNLASLKMMLGVGEETYIVINTFDMIVSFAYLTFLMAFGIRLFRKILPYKMKENNFTRKNPKIQEEEINVAELNDDLYIGIFNKENWLQSLKAIGFSLLIVAISLGLSFLITGGVNMIILMLSLTTLAILASGLKGVRKARKSYDIGMYLVLIFSLVIASMVDITEIRIGQSIAIFLYLLFTILFSLTIQIILAKIFKVDADTTVITSVTLINSPLFVPMIAESMKNKKVIITGITIGIIGYAIGNYLGVLVSLIL